MSRILRPLRAVPAVLVLTAAAALGSGGCAPAPSTADARTAKTTATPASTPTPSTPDSAACCDVSDDGTPAPAVELKVVTFDQWQGAVEAQRGKVVVVGVWGAFCLPCRKEFPHLVELNRRYARDGVVCMSVSVDPVEGRGSALAFLKTQGAGFANYWLNADHHLWQDKWDVNGLPAALVFDRDGRQVRKFDNDDVSKPFAYSNVEKLVKQLILEVHSPHDLRGGPLPGGKP
jgi:thiol-disulfide isomerase/thioredoxin